MDIEFNEAEPGLPFDRVYGIDVILRNFKGCPHCELTLFRYGATEEELEALKGRNLVVDNPDVPREVLAGATEENALKYLLENFTREEVTQFLDYLEKRYADLVEKVIVAPLEVPVPLGTGPIAPYPATKTAGFVCFDKADDYPLPFAVRAYFDFNLQEELSEAQA